MDGTLGKKHGPHNFFRALFNPLQISTFFNKKKLYATAAFSSALRPVNP